MIYRFHFRAQLKEEIPLDSEDLQRAIEQCRFNISSLIQEKRVLTASLFYADHMLFLYYEAIGERKVLPEPVEQERAWKMQDCFEAGECLQTTCVHPDEFMTPLSGMLETWPGQSGKRNWVYMYHIYYHQEPQGVEQWMQDRHPDRKRGRIAFLRTDKVFSYTYNHKALVEEGLIRGDKYMSISLHENILFSYFEEPRSSVNLSGRDEESKILKEYVASGDRAHFIHMKEGEGENFMLLPELFTI